MLEATREACHEAAADNQPGCVAALGSTVAAGATRAAQEPVARLLLGRAQADAARSLALRPAENVPVYVMLPLDTVNAEGVFRYAYVPWFAQALQVLALSGVHGVAVDVWWCAIERSPRQYSWMGYKQLFEMVRAVGLKVQVVLSFHACGGNVGDMAQVPLPPWVLQAGLSDPDIFFTDRPRESGLGQRNKEYVSIWADDCPVLPAGSGSHSAGGGFGGRQAGAGSIGGSGPGSGPGSNGGMRTPLQCYYDFMVAFRDEFAAHLGTLIEEVVVGSGPCGELRYPSYVEANGWRFPGVGEFQCYDRRALASLAAAAEAAGHPEWGYAGPHDSGGYNSLPLDTDFFKPHGGSWDTDYGNFFLSWYSSCLLQHGERLLQLANQAFAPFRPQPQKTLFPHAQAILHHLQHLLHSGSSNGGDGSSSFAGSEWGLAVAAAAAAVAAAGAVAGGSPAASAVHTPAAAGAAVDAAASVEAGAQQALGLLQELLAAGSGGAAGCGSGDCGSGSMSPADARAVPAGAAAAAGPVLGTQPAGVPPLSPVGSNGGQGPGLSNGAPAPTAAAAAAGQQLAPQPLTTASGLLQQLLQSCGDASSSLGLTSAVNGGQLSPAFAAAVAAAAAAGGCGSNSRTVASPLQTSAAAAVAAAGGLYVAGVGPGSECTHISSVSMPAASSLQSSSSTLDLNLSVPDLLSASQQHLAGLSLNSSRESDLSLSQGGSGSPQPPAGPLQAAAAAAAAAGTHRPGVSQLLQVSACAAGLPLGAGALSGISEVPAAVEAPAEADEVASVVSAHCNGAGMASTAAGSGGSGSDTSCQTACGVALTAAAAAAAAAADLSPVAAASTADNCNSSGNSAAAVVSSAVSTSSPCSSSARCLPVGAAAAPAGPAVMHLFLQLLSSLAPPPLQQQQPQQPAVLAAAAQRQRQVPRLQALAQQRRPLVLSLKIAGVHWWYNSTSHASELTAGYYNTDSRDGYSPILELCERYNVNLTITCVEMCDAQHPSYALCGPEGLLRQIRAMAAHRQVTLSGENALPIFTPNGIDATALDRVVSNVRACRSASLRSCSSWPGPGPSSNAGTGSSRAGSGGGYGQHHYQQQFQPNHHQHQQQQYSGGWGSTSQTQQPSMLASLGGMSSSAYALDSIQRQSSGGGGWPPQPPQQQQQQQQRLLQQHHHQQQQLWYGEDRIGGHQHTRSHITSNSRNFSELGTLLQVYGSGGSGSAGTPGSGAAVGGGVGGAGAFAGGFWQQCSSDGSGQLGNGGRSSSPGVDSSGSSSGNQQHHPQLQHQQQQQRRSGQGQGKAGAAGGGSSGGGSGQSELLPAMRAFTFLRLGPEILQPECHTSWMRFMHRMLNERA